MMAVGRPAIRGGQFICAGISELCACCQVYYLNANAINMMVRALSTISAGIS